MTDFPKMGFSIPSRVQHEGTGPSEMRVPYSWAEVSEPADHRRGVDRTSGLPFAKDRPISDKDRAALNWKRTGPVAVAAMSVTSSGRGSPDRCNGTNAGSATVGFHLDSWTGLAF